MSAAIERQVQAGGRRKQEVLMRAIVAHAAKDLRIEEVATPDMGPDEIRVRLAFGGICGSDLHYFNHGGFGAVRLREPMILGHEISGTVEAVGASTRRIKVGDRVAICPSRPCNHCRYCLEGKQNQCLDMRFYGSAMRFPHVQGAFREQLVCDETQAHVVPDHLSLGEAAMAEPLSVCLHAVRRAGSLMAKRVLVTGCGPIGALTVLAARRAGAVEIVVTDIAERTLDFARTIGADRAVNVQSGSAALAEYHADKGYFDVTFEASGAEAAARSAIEATRPGGVLVQLGLGGDMSLPMQAITAKELELRGTFRFHEEFGQAIAFMAKGLIDVKPLISSTAPLADAVAAFQLANDRSRAMKVQITF
jgi:L-idonate 5-dehydrogenase